MMKRNKVWDLLKNYWKFDKWYILSMVVIIIIVAIIGNYMENQENKITELKNSCNAEDNCVGDTHIHADFKMFVGSREVELYKPENFERDECIHFHEGLEDVLHVHCPGATIGDFLKSINTTLIGNFLIVVNEFSAYLDYEVQDLDKILITDADNYSLVLEQYDLIVDLASEG